MFVVLEIKKVSHVSLNPYIPTLFYNFRIIAAANASGRQCVLIHSEAEG